MIEKNIENVIKIYRMNFIMKLKYFFISMNELKLIFY